MFKFLKSKREQNFNFHTFIIFTKNITNKSQVEKIRESIFNWFEKNKCKSISMDLIDKINTMEYQAYSFNKNTYIISLPYLENSKIKNLTSLLYTNNNISSIKHYKFTNIFNMNSYTKQLKSNLRKEAI